jgi:Tol biopolymer transport system component
MKNIRLLFISRFSHTLTFLSISTLFVLFLFSVSPVNGQIKRSIDQKEAATAPSQGFEGYYQQPTLHGETIVFVAEGDLWKVPSRGGLAQRLTTHAGEESYPRISPDGNTIAFSATYEGPTEVYTMPVNGGLPERWTYQASPSFVNTWTAAGELVYATRHFSTLPRLSVGKNRSRGKKRILVFLYTRPAKELSLPMGKACSSFARLITVMSPNGIKAGPLARSGGLPKEAPKR